MAHITLDALNDTSVKGIMQFPSLDFALFWPLIQFAIFWIIVFSSYFAEKERTGRGNFLSSLAVGGFISIIIGLLLNLMEVIDRTTFVITFVLGIICVVIYMLTDR